MIVKRGSFWYLMTQDGRRVLGKHRSRKAAETQEQLVKRKKAEKRKRSSRRRG